MFLGIFKAPLKKQMKNQFEKAVQGYKQGHSILSSSTYLLN